MVSFAESLRHMEMARRRQELEIRSQSSSASSTGSNASSASRTDRALTRGDHAADLIMAFGSLLTATGSGDPSGMTLLAGACIAGAGGAVKGIIWICVKCKNKFQSWREERHRNNCTEEYCQRCWNA